MHSRPPSRGLEVETIGDVTVVRFTLARILSEDQIQSLGQQLLSLLADPSRRRFVVNFGSVESMASMMVGKLFALRQRVEAVGGRVVLCQIPDGLYEVFNILKVPQLIRCYEDEQEALQSF